MKPVKRAVAAVVRGDGSGRERRILAVRRPADDPELPGLWGLPAVSVGGEEDDAEAIHRLGREKLGVRFEALRDLREGTLERSSYLLHMKLYEARIVEGEPAVPQPCAGVTQYVEWTWADALVLLPAARRGSLCCRLYLRELGEGWT